MTRPFAVLLPFVIVLKLPSGVSAQLVNGNAEQPAANDGPTIRDADDVALLDVSGLWTACGACEEARDQYTTVYWHRFPDGGGGGSLINSGEWEDGGNRNCWGTPDDQTCHEEESLTRCDDSHSECGGGNLILTTALQSPEPGRAVRQIVAAHGLFWLDPTGTSVTVYDCSGAAQKVLLPEAVTRDLLEDAHAQPTASTSLHLPE